MMFANTMYLRPGNLWKEFRRMKNQSANIGGNFEKKYVDTGEIITGILAQATVNDKEMTQHLWDQSQHSLTHTVVISGACKVKKMDLLVFEDRAYLVLANDMVGNLGVAGIIYLEERNDIK